MDFFDVIKKRRSVREYTNDPVPKEDLKEMVRIATFAPSASNKQMWKFVVITNQKITNRMSQVVKDKIDKLAQDFEVREKLDHMKTFSSFFNHAPAVIVVLHEPYEGGIWNHAKQQGWTDKEINRLRAHPGLQSIGAAIQNLLLAAEAMGYGACWMTAPVIAAHEIEEILKIEKPWELAAIIPIGKPASKPDSKPRKPLEETLEFWE